MYTLLSWREVRIRYKQSVMGLMWAVLMPVIITLAGVIIRIAATKLSGRPVSGADIGAIGVKALPWAFFISALRFGTVTVSSKGTFRRSFEVPCTVAGGDHTVTATAPSRQNAAADVTLGPCAVTLAPDFAG